MSKISFMSAVEIKNQIHKYLDQVDESFLKAIHSMLDTYVKGKEDKVIGYDVKNYEKYRKNG